MNAHGSLNKRGARVLAALLIATSPALARAAGEGDKAPAVAGVGLPERIEVEAQSLVLNGAALRKIALIKIYVAGLYLPDRENRADAILAADSPRSLVMHFLRDVKADRLCEGWDSSLEATSLTRLPGPFSSAR